MSSDQNLVGIDFSINSPAFCCYKSGSYTWGSVTRSDRSAESHLRNPKKPFSVLDSSDEFKIHFINRIDLPENYVEKERIKISYFLDIVESLWEKILEIMGEDNFSVAMEGLSFSSNGNSLIDISMATALLREKIINKVGVENFYVFSPTSIKKYALKGNAKKDELYEALCNFKESGTNLEKFTSILEVNKPEWITPARAINKPIDDIVDATWINLYLKNQLREINGNSEPLFEEVFN